MARGKRRLPHRPADPIRQQRIEQNRESEKRMRDALGRALKLGKQLSDRMHYDKLAKEVTARWEAVVPRLTELVATRLEILERCFLAHYELQREIDGLQREVDRRSGKPLPPTLLERVEPMLSALPDKQANALRFIAGLHEITPARALEDTTAHRNASQWLADFTETLGAVEREGAPMTEIAHERVKRGWVDEGVIREFEEQLATSLTALKTALVSTREYLASFIETYGGLRDRRVELQRTLGTI